MNPDQAILSAISSNSPEKQARSESILEIAWRRKGLVLFVLFFAAAGNEPVPTPMYPAAYPEVIAVTAISRSGQIASWANYGSFVDVGAPGSSVVSFGNQAYVVTGTSSSTAFASGIAAAASQATGKTGPNLSPLVIQSLAIPGRKY